MINFIKLLSETSKSDEHEQNIADAFINKTLPGHLPKWMIDLGIKSGAKVIKSKNIGSNIHKSDVIVDFNIGESLRISAKMSNADFFGNWYWHEKVRDDLGEEFIDPITNAALSFAKSIESGKYRSKKNEPILGIAISFGKRAGKTGIDFAELISSKKILNIIVGSNPNDKKNANCLYATTDVPNDINKLINSLSPLSETTVEKLLRNFKIIFRIIYSDSGNVQLKKPLWIMLKLKDRRTNDKLFVVNNFEKIKKYSEFVPIERYSYTPEYKIINNFRKENIYLIQK
jgi:hypothetical protein